MTYPSGVNADPVAQLGRLGNQLTVYATPDERDAAALTVCHNAAGPGGVRWGTTADGTDTGPWRADAAELLGMLGLEERT